MTQVMDNAKTSVSKFRWADLLGKLGPVIGLAFVCILFASLTYETFVTVSNFQVMLTQTAVVGMASLGMTIIIIAGGIDLSFGSTVALSGVVVALLLQRGWSPVLAGVGGVGTGALCGLVIGLLITRLKLMPFIVTLGTMTAFRGLAKCLGSEAMVNAPDTWMNRMLNGLGEGQQWMIFPPGVWLVIVFSILVAAMLRYTRFGRHVFAIGSNEQTARLCGVRVDRRKVLIYTVGAAFAGLAGILQFGYLTVGDPTTADGMELNVIAAVVIGGASLNGGRGSILGTLIGALIMTVVSNGCTKVGLSSSVQQIVTGAIIILAVALDGLQHRTKA